MNMHTLKGFRDFLPLEKRRRDYIQSKISHVFELFGFEPIETPTLEYAELLLGKYGTEADKLVYSFTDRGDRHVALRYDQTVPTSRVLVEHSSLLPRFFRRYQMQNVFRAEKPQKGRYRELMHCDIDIYGATSTIADAEVLACIFQVYKHIGFPTVQIVVNDRKTLLDTFTPFATVGVDVYSIIQTLDKLEKIGKDGVIEELTYKGLTKESVVSLFEKLKHVTASSTLLDIIEKAVSLGVDRKSLVFSPSLARGLDYYTGMIAEVVLPEYQSGSVAGGGRYDDLIGKLGSIDMPAVGMAIGFDRTVEAAHTLGLIPDELMTQSIMIAPLSEESTPWALEIAHFVRMQGMPVEVSPGVLKIEKQLKSALEKNMRYFITIGEDEVKKKVMTIKDLKNRTIATINKESFHTFLQKQNDE